jgi:phosphatidylglycerophosphate synthase
MRYRWIPWSLVLLRLLLGPLLVIGNHYLSDHGILTIYLLAFLSDYFDGVSARRLGTATPRLRKADSTVDTIFHVFLGAVTIYRHAEELVRNQWMIAAYLVTLAAWYVIDAIRWRRPAGFHAYSAKLFSVGLMFWMIALYSGMPTGLMLSVIMAIGVLSNLDGLTISFLLRHDRTDVKGVWKLLFKDA